MTMARTAIGATFLAVLFFGVVYAVVSPVLQPITFPQFNLPWLTGTKVIDKYSLIKGANVSDVITRVNLNVYVKTGAINMLFTNTSNLACDIIFERSTNASELEANYTATGDALQVNLIGEAGGMNLTLGNSYQYNGTFTIGIGGAMVELGQYANVTTFTVNVKYAGGLALKIDNQASFQQIDTNVDIGGVQLTVDADSLKNSGIINANVNIGGFSMTADVNTSQIGVSLNATVDIGGIAVNHADFTGQVSTRSCSVKTVGYASAANKLDINATIGLGGAALQQMWPFPFSFGQ
ncbi:MAG TPA: hypothetical protein VIH48_02625 [Candidatus Bathyarchaeia archaeon]